MAKDKKQLHLANVAKNKIKIQSVLKMKRKIKLKNIPQNKNGKHAFLVA